MIISQKIEAIRAKCVEANKSILDLENGCRIAYKTRTGHFTAKILYKNYAGNYHMAVCGFPTYLTLKEKEIKEIIGRDILLSDVLNAMKEKQTGDKIIAIVMLWNILRPSLEEQEEETISLIYKILCAK